MIMIYDEIWENEKMDLPGCMIFAFEIFTFLTRLLYFVSRWRAHKWMLTRTKQVRQAERERDFDKKVTRGALSLVSIDGKEEQQEDILY